MNINLKKYAKYVEKESVTLHITDRLPYFMRMPSDVICHFQVVEYPDYDLLKLEIEALLHIVCQRCLEPFDYTYRHSFDIAVCRRDDIATQYMLSLDCMVAQSGEVDLLEIVTDELHLCGHEKHEDITQCNQILSAHPSH